MCQTFSIYTYSFFRCCFKGRHFIRYIALNEETRECSYRAVRGCVITLTIVVFYPHPVSCLEGQHRQVGSCFQKVTTNTKCKCSDLCYSVQHNIHEDANIITLDIDKEDIYPRPGSSEYTVNRVVPVAYVSDDIGEYQGTAAPGTAA